jgi:sphingomyelin phosphodiesterase acid-like 3
MIDLSGPVQPHHVYGKYGCDSPYLLVESVLYAMKSVDATPDFILLPGDHSAHYFTKWTETVDAIKNATFTITKYFPSTPVFPMLGTYNFREVT